MKKRRKVNWKSWITFVLIGALAIAAVAGLASLFHGNANNTKNISPGVFSVGALDDNGRHVDSETSVFTKDLIGCQGLVIKPDFTTKGTYRVFFYNEEERFISATELLNPQDGVFTLGEEYSDAVYCRIMITPLIPADVEVEDFKIRAWEVRGYANDYTITVNKSQPITAPVLNLFEADRTDYACIYDEGYISMNYVSQLGVNSTKILSVSEYKYLQILAKGNSEIKSIYWLDAPVLGYSEVYGECLFENTDDLSEVKIGVVDYNYIVVNYTGDSGLLITPTP